MLPNSGGSDLLAALRTIALVLALSLFGGATLAQTFDVGVIRESTIGCPSGSEQIIINMDDEDDDNISAVSGWTGAISRSAIGTQFVFCRTNGVPFVSIRHDYAVLQLGPFCPNGSKRMARLFDNENDDTASQWSGNIAPNFIARWIKLGGSPSESEDTMLYFCFFPADPLATPNTLPSIGVPYGVFATPQAGAPWLASGWVYTDDEDDCPCSSHSQDLTYTPSAFEGFQQIVYGNDLRTGGRNTVLLTVKAHDGSICPAGTCTDWRACRFVRAGSRWWQLRSSRDCCLGGKWITETKECDFRTSPTPGPKRLPH